MINERMSESLVFLSKSLICSFAHQKQAIRSKKNLTKIKFFGVFLYFFVSFKKTSDSLIPSFLMSDVSESLRLLTKNEQCEWIASGCLPQMFNYEGFAQVAHQK